MCSGGRLVADLMLGTTERPTVPPPLEASLTTSTDDRWVIWAYKVARPVGECFRPMTGGRLYPADASAQCLLHPDHDAPDPTCTCGFHALSDEWAGFGGGAFVQLEVALTGRVLVFEWAPGGALFRAEQQTVARINRHRTSRLRPLTRAAPWAQPPEPDGRLARLQNGVPAGSGPMRLDLPTASPPAMAVYDDVGLCAITPPVADPTRPAFVLT